MGKAVRAERESPLRHEEVQAFIAALYEGELHTKRVTALAGATLGVMASASLAVAVIGQALAQARGLVTKHAIKQVDRLLSKRASTSGTASPAGCRATSWSRWTGRTTTVTDRRPWC